MTGHVKLIPFVGFKTMVWSMLWLFVPLVAQRPVAIKPSQVNGMFLAAYGRYLSAGINPMTPVQMSLGPTVTAGSAPSPVLSKDAGLLEYYVSTPGVWLARVLCGPDTASAVPGTGDCARFRACLNVPPPPDEKETLRETWRKTFGIDVWYPYYKAREIEGWVKERFGVKIFNLKGQPEFSKGKVTIVFKSNF